MSGISRYAAALHFLTVIPRTSLLPLSCSTTGAVSYTHLDVYKRQVSLTMTVQEWKQYSKSERSMMLPGIYVTPRKSTVDVKI